MKRLLISTAQREIQRLNGRRRLGCDARSFALTRGIDQPFVLARTATRFGGGTLRMPIPLWGTTRSLWCKYACGGADVHGTLGFMPKSEQIRDLDDEVYAALVRRAAEQGISVPELLRTEAARLAARPSVEEWLRRTRQRSSDLDRTQVLDALDEQRGTWPDVRH